MSIRDREFKNLTFSEVPSSSSFEECTFYNCDLSKSDLSAKHFEHCSFIECDLSNSNIVDTAFQEVQFVRCKLMGLLFETAKPFLFSIEAQASNLEQCSFFQCALLDSQFSSCNLSHCDFSESNCTGLSFHDCDLDRAVFERTSLTQANFSSAHNFTIDLSLNSVKECVFSKDNLTGLLSGFPIKII